MRRFESRSFERHLIAALAVAATLWLVTRPAFAQEAGSGAKVPERTSAGSENWHELPPGGPAPRTADGHPDLSGVWFPNSAGRQVQRAYPIDPAARRQFDPKVTPEEKPVLIPGSENKYKRQQLRYGDCVIPSTPGTLLQENTTTWPMQLIQTPDRLVMLIEYPMDFRVIHTDGRPHPKDPDPTFNGNSVAHWEGETLVIDTVALDTRANFGGWFHSEKEHVIERLSRPSKNYLIHQVTVEDPLVLAKPWNSAPRKWSLSVVADDDLDEFFCTTNEEPQERQKEGRPANVQLGLPPAGR
jgi:hypothetical protein